MQLFVKLYGRKEFAGMQPLVISAEPTDAVSIIAAAINSITGTSAEMLMIMTGMSVRNPSGVTAGSFRKLEHSATLADSGLGDQSTLIASLSRPQSTNALSTVAQVKRRRVCVAKAHYRPSPTQPLKTADVVAVTGDGRSCRTTLQYEGVEYDNALEWLAKAFNNSGKSCFVPVERTCDIGTPRPKYYVPPSARCPFGAYC